MRTGSIVVAIVIAALSGCAGSFRLRAFPSDRALLKVPFFSDDGRGPAALASVLSFWETPTEPKDIKGHALDRPRYGAFPRGLLLAAQERGMQARSFQATIDDVRKEIKLGHPVVAYLRLASWIAPKECFVVITGFDDARGGLYVHSRRGANRFWDYGSFVSKWERTGRWAILVMPAGEATANDLSARAL